MGKPLKSSRKPRKRILEGKKRGERLLVELTCPKSSCGHKWFPKPTKWRNMHNPFGSRTLSCSQCGRKIKLSAKQVELIWKHNI